MEKKKLVIVESPAKCKTIGKILPDCIIVASYGHVRQVLSKKNGVQINDKIEFLWETDKEKMKRIEDKITKNIDEILIATDLDREGEAIGFHLESLLSKYNIPISRIIFSEITEPAIINAIKNKSILNKNLIDAYFHRVALDHRMGFALSGILYQLLLLRNNSAGRVQTPTLGFLVKIAMEILKFVEEKFFTIEALVQNPEILHENIKLELYSFKGKKIQNLNKEDAQEIINNLQNISNSIAIFKETKQKKTKITPPAPFTTAALQQEGPSLGLSIGEISKISQTLYEDGFITYIRTDSVRLSEDIMKELEKYITSHYDNLYERRIFKNKSKNTQEAHECIRPTNINEKLDSTIYNTIRLRTIASQTKEAIRITDTHYYTIGDAIFKINDTYLQYLGFYEILGTNLSTKPKKILEKLQLKFVSTEHETQPPHYLSDAGIVKAMEKEGIGRPSTYVSTIKTLLERNYITKKGSSLQPTQRGCFVYFLIKYLFSKYINIEFTAKLEEELDNIARGNSNHNLFQLIKEIDENIKLNGDRQEILKEISNDFIKTFHKKCSKGHQLELRIKYNLFLHCSECNINLPFEEIETINETQIIYGTQIILQNGEKKVYLPSNFQKNDLNEKIMDLLLSLPQEIIYIDENKISHIMLVGMSKYGFYVKYNNKYSTIFFKNLLELANFENGKFNWQIESLFKKNKITS